MQREIAPLVSGLAAHRGAQATLVVQRLTAEPDVPKEIDVVPLWRFLLDRG